MHKISSSLSLILISLLVSSGFAQNQPNVFVREAPALRLPGGRNVEAGIYDSIDCNSPLHWDAQGRLHVFSSVQFPYHSVGPDLFRLANPLSMPQAVRINTSTRQPIPGGVWLEATYRDSNGLLYGWYHNERRGPCDDTHLTIPRIGAMVSADEGASWQDLGIVMQAGESTTDCLTENYYFAGGEGDFSVVLDQEKQFFYFFFGAYHDALDEQGVCVARMRYADRNNPLGRVWKYYQGKWSQPGLNGRVSPIFPAMVDWHRRDANALWGPATHYNTYLQCYVMLLNHAINGQWAQAGVYISYNKFPGNPAGWSTPLRLALDPQGRAYPEVIGLQKGETDKLLGQVGRLFLLGESNWELVFQRPNEGNAQNFINAHPLRNASAGSRQNLPARVR
jgi:hypothetical protein